MIRRKRTCEHYGTWFLKMQASVKLKDFVFCPPQRIFLPCLLLETGYNDNSRRLKNKNHVQNQHNLAVILIGKRVKV